MYRRKQTFPHCKGALHPPGDSNRVHLRIPDYIAWPLRCIHKEGVLPAALFFFTLFLSPSCTPPPPVIPCPEPIWKEYTDYKPHQVTGEMERLVSQLHEHDSTDTNSLSELAITQRLFELSIHRANPEFNADKIYTYLTYCYQHGGPDSLRYLNWGRVIRDHKTVLEERDSLAASIADCDEQDSRKNGRVRRLLREKKECVQKHDSLSTIITRQQETIQKLQKLDVLMEQQRSKIQ